MHRTPATAFEPPEPITFVTVVNDFAELGHNLRASPVAASTVHEWMIIDNTGNRRSDDIGKLYCEAQARAANDLVFFMHQDVYLPAAWEAQVFEAIAQLEARDPAWGVIGAVGALPFGAPKPRLRGHWADPNHPHAPFFGPLPSEVVALDELWLGIRRRRGLSFDPALPGFHCYGIDLCLTAARRGLRCYAIDAFVHHQYKNAHGARITDKNAATKIRHYRSAEFARTAQPSKDYIRQKWRAQLPLRSTSMTWELDEHAPPAARSVASMAKSGWRPIGNRLGIGRA